MSKTITPTLIALVKDEAKKLKKNATPKELNRLDITSLCGTSSSSCVYGLLTGSCNSERASELIYKCATRVYEVPTTYKNAVIDSKLNGKPKIKRHSVSHYVSPIEKFIFINEENGSKKANEKLIKYLKNETKTLNFK